MAVPERIEQARQELPAAAAKFAQIVVDNPGQFVFVAAGALVIGRAAMNIVRPRTAAEALALMLVLQLGTPKLIELAIARGWLKFRVRDEEGHLVPLEVPDPNELYFYPGAHGIDCRGHRLDETVRERAKSGCPVVPNA